MLIRTLLRRFLSIVNFVAPISTLIVKCNVKPWFHIDVLSAIRNTVKNSNDQAKKLTKAILNVHSFY